MNEIFYARYKLHKNLYKHPKVNGIELMIIDALKILDKQGKFKQYCQ